ncbi:MAG TPA: ABC transporter permease [Caulobacteraceae bacterium]|jgi:osmoprotectant transport system permease protein|nr:ABC transporter permease [Caulobacteraceae bacterium]
MALILWFSEHWGEFLTALSEHLILCGIAMTAAILIGLPVSILIAGRERLSLVVVNGISALRTVPSLAILAIMMPFLGIGRWPCVVALVILALPPIVINSVAGLRGVDPDLLDAAAGMGMRRRQILWRVQAPLAASAMFAGVRTSLIQVLAGAALAPFIGGGGLGDFITTGIGLRDTTRLLAGAIPIALLALFSEVAMGLAEKTFFGAGSRR